MLNIGKYLILVFLFFGCSGPTSPFGAFHIITLPDRLFYSDTYLQESNSESTILARPAKQVLHDSAELDLYIYTRPEDLGHQVSVFYNGLDVSDQFLRSAVSRYDDDYGTFRYRFSHFRLSPKKQHDISFIYKGPDGEESVFVLPPPDCDILKIKDIISTGTHRPKVDTIITLEYWSRLNLINPSFIAALVAQESGFNTQAISWAKALGLTQITPIADKQIQEIFVDWPRSEVIDRVPASLLKMMIATGELSAEDDWRLDPELSIRGGIAHLKYIIDYWKREPHEQILKNHFGDDDIFSEVVMASYNSGPARVKYAIEQRGKNYLKHVSLSEARLYVGRVKSYCYHFSH